ncbi:hypothetical protein [Bacillus gaemokensis]|uniref:Uncharacterized protein n=1 Tax=Bacillus gaemokensis TaxID=574375 RepID=A0A073KJ14_9BACI|nr:hypothetical protein [Bacillus gaemokensis]KEK26466.1 hypothetical protein BAGA_04305 [Bacillus gaemokensis]KYG39268.1 hypothetical protein AZF08_04340 [Bacillus gaemokensis]
MKFERLLERKPTMEWKLRMNDGDEIFTNENIEATSEVLNIYVRDLQKITERATEKEIMECVEKVVVSLNELNERYDFFIETLEREELYEFIVEAASIAGLEVEEDITEEWREW